MAWSVELSTQAQKNLRALDAQVARRILSFLHEQVSTLEDPRSLGEAPHGARLGNPWKYRVGDCRLICDLQDGMLRVLVVKAGHRREVYG